MSNQNLLAKYSNGGFNKETDGRKRRMVLRASQEGFIDNLFKMFRRNKEIDFEKFDTDELITFLRENPDYIEGITLDKLFSKQDSILQDVLANSNIFKVNEVSDILATYDKQLKLNNRYIKENIRLMNPNDFISTGKLPSLGHSLNKKLDVLNGQSLKDAFSKSINVHSAKDKNSEFEVVEYTGMLISLTGMLLIRTCKFRDIFFRFYTTIERDNFDSLKSKITYQKDQLTVDDVIKLINHKYDSSDWAEWGVSNIEEGVEIDDIAKFYKSVEDNLKKAKAEDVTQLNHILDSIYADVSMSGGIDYMVDWFDIYVEEEGESVEGKKLSNRGICNFLINILIDDYYYNFEQFFFGYFGEIEQIQYNVVESIVKALMKK
ncbi:MAG: hypothetical protein IBX57_00575 [Gammaproteobacteria bacterium]|nr:hypothetical protein [Gammaproteobacteria bacterium]